MSETRCSFCNRPASVTYRYAASLRRFYCGEHATEILGALPAELVAATERAA